MIIDPERILKAVNHIQDTIDFGLPSSVSKDDNDIFITIPSQITRKWHEFLQTQMSRKSDIHYIDRIYAYCLKKAKALLPFVAAQYIRNPNIVLTGYADGGTIARIITLMLEEKKIKVSLITFGEPFIIAGMISSVSTINDQRVIMYGDEKFNSTYAFRTCDTSKENMVFIINNTELTDDISKWYDYVEKMRVLDISLKQCKSSIKQECEMINYSNCINNIYAK